MRSNCVRGEVVGVEERGLGRSGGVVDDGAAEDGGGDENRESF